MAELTEQQRAVLQVIVEYWASQCCPPTVRDLQEALGFRSPNSILRHLQPLLKKGAIQWERDGKSRGIWPAGLPRAIRAAVAKLAKLAKQSANHTEVAK